MARPLSDAAKKGQNYLDALNSAKESGDLHKPGYTTQQRSYELITPLFGGGVEPNTADPVTVVRVPEVRGHLRFWWRATRGGHFGGDLAKMKEAEGLLWGSTEHPSLISIDLEIIEKDEIYPLVPEHRSRPVLDASECKVYPVRNPKVAKSMNGKSFYSDKNGSIQSLSDIGSPNSIDSYIAFPLRDKSSNVLLGVKFKLRFTFPREWPKGWDVTQKALFSHAKNPGEELGAALWAWESFGGLGARTRRGCGAVDLVAVDVPVAELDYEKPRTLDGFAKLADRFVLKRIFPASVPYIPNLSDWFVIKEPFENGVLAWRAGGKLLSAFRQQRPELNRRPGRNRWPEPDEVRRLTKRSLPRHKNPISLVQKFPRGQFGLPLIIQYKADDQRSGDPQGMNTLQLPGANRFASPLILRPYRQDGHIVLLGLVMAGSRIPERLELQTNAGVFPVSSQLTPDEAEQIHDIHGEPLFGSETDVLRAFLNYLKES